MQKMERDGQVAGGLSSGEVEGDLILFPEFKLPLVGWRVAPPASSHGW